MSDLRAMRRGDEVARAGIGLWLALAGAIAGISALLWARGPLWALAALAGLIGLAAILLGWPIVPFLALHLAALFTHYKWEVGPVSVRPEHVAVLAIGALLAWHLLDRRRWPVVTLPGWFALAWWGMNVLATLVNALDPRDSLRHIIRLFLMVLTYLVVVNLIRTRAQWRIAAAGYLALGAMESAYGLTVFALQPLGVRVGLQRNIHVPVLLPYGTLEEANHFGSHSAAWALAFLFLLLALWRTRWRWWSLAGLILTGLATVVSFARGAWISAVIGGALTFIFYGRGRRERWQRAALLAILGPLSLIALVAAVWVAPPEFPLVARLRTFSSLATDPTFSARLEQTKWALAEWRQHPWIGWGPGAFYQIHGIVRYIPAWISNLTVRTLHETGLFGALFFYGWALLALALAVRAAREAPALDRALLLGLAIGFLSLLIAYHATDGTWLAEIWIHVGLMVAGALATLRERAHARPAASHPLRA